MNGHICPWWLGYFLINPFRRFWHNPKRILSPLVAEGMTVLEPGCGMGFFTLDLARLVGRQGKVIAVDLQSKMLDGLMSRARKAGLDGRIEARLAQPASLGLEDYNGRIDFILAFAMIHELPDAKGFFIEAHRALKPGGRLLAAEPRGHVTESAFAAMLALAAAAGFRVESRPPIAISRAAVLVRV